MKRALVIVAMLLALATTAMASETSWAMRLVAYNEFGTNHGTGAALGVDPVASDSFDDRDNRFSFVGDGPGITATLVSRINGEYGAFSRDVRAPGALPKVWDLHLAANCNATYSQLQVRAYTISYAPLPTAQYDANRVRYYLAMVDNKGVVGAPANGTRWMMPTPAAYSASPFWVMPTNLPVIKITAQDSYVLFNEGYHLQFVQELVPEPSSLLALGMCLSAIAGCTLRRRRASSPRS